MLTDDGVERVEKRLGVGNLYDPENIERLHHVEQALRAHTLYKRDGDYVVEDGEVLIVDEFTGREMPGRRWSDGLHQAIEAKEGVKIEDENQTLATITFQNYFRMYTKLSGMTGTADTEAGEFHEIYKLDVMVIPTNRPMVRKDHEDVVYKTEREKFKAVADEIERAAQEGPAGAGRHGLASPRARSSRSLLKKRGIPHNVLNAKQHEREATSSRRPGARARSPSPPTWPAAAPTSSSAATPRFMARAEVGRTARARRSGAGAGRPPEGKPPDRRARRLRTKPRSSSTRRSSRRPSSATRLSARRSTTRSRARRPVHPRHRAAREPPHRQPAARPRRPPGRSRHEPLLPVARRRSDAHLRRPSASPG